MTTSNQFPYQYPYQEIIARHLGPHMSLACNAWTTDMVAMRRSLADCIDEMRSSGYPDVECDIRETTLEEALLVRAKIIEAHTYSPEWAKLDPENFRPMTYLVFHLYDSTFYSMPLGWSGEGGEAVAA